jgi:hypothetical protein
LGYVWIKREWWLHRIAIVYISYFFMGRQNNQHHPTNVYPSQGKVQANDEKQTAKRDEM